MSPFSSCEMATFGVLALYLIEALTPSCFMMSMACASTTLFTLGVLCTIIVKRWPLMSLLPPPAADDGAWAGDEPPDPPLALVVAGEAAGLELLQAAASTA